MFRKHADRKRYDDAELQHYYSLKPQNMLLKAIKNSSLVIGIMVTTTLIS